MTNTFKGLDNRLRFLGFLLSDLTALVIVFLVLHQIVNVMVDFACIAVLAIIMRRLKDRPANYFLTLMIFLALPSLLGVAQSDDLPVYKAIV